MNNSDIVISCIFCLMLSLLLHCNKKQDLPVFQADDLFSLTVQTMEKQSLDLDSLRKNTATVFLFLSPECPIAQKYTSRVDSLNQQYKKEGIAFYGVFPGILALKEKSKEFSSTYNLSFDIIDDREMNLLQLFSARISPEVFVIDSSGRLKYKGQIDNWFFALGKKRQVITQNYLVDALNAIVNGKPILQKETKAIGCYLPRK